MLVYIALAILVIIVMAGLTSQYSSASPVTVVQPVPVLSQPNQAVSIVPSLVNPITPPGLTTAQTCRNGVYCNMQPVLPADAYVGAPPVCGTDRVQYSCVNGIVGPVWNRLGTTCTAGQLAACS